MKYIVHFGYNDPQEAGLIRAYAEAKGYAYQWEGLKNDLFNAATPLKFASMAVIWNGLQYGSALAAKLCRRRGIPVCFLEMGLLPQSTTYLVDPGGFCGDSILSRDLSWVTREDLARLHAVRADLQSRYPLKPESHALAVLQIENDTQILYYSPYRRMEEFMADVEEMYPGTPIIARPHPRSPLPRSFARAVVRSEGDFLAEAARAQVVVGITSTCLYEAAILGVPVLALGDHPLRIQPKHLHDQVLAGALALRLDRTKGALAPILDRLGVQPL